MLLCCAFLPESCTKEDYLLPEGEPVMLSLNFNSPETAPSPSFAYLPQENNAEDFIKTLRILVFSASREKIYNQLFTPGVHRTWTTRIAVKPGTYTFHAIANEAPGMTEKLDGITGADSFSALPSLRQVKREDGMIRENGNIVAFLMKGETKDVEVDNAADGGSLTVAIPLKRLLAKVEMRFENRLPAGMSGGFDSFSLGRFPRYFSFFEEGIYPASTESGDGGKEWKTDRISPDESYVYYIPPYTPERLKPGEEDHFPHLTFLFNWNIGGFQYSDKRDFRESDQNTDEHDVKSNYHYQYTIRLSRSPLNPLEVQCTIVPWTEEPVQDYYVDECCNLKIEKDGPYTKFILLHADHDPTFVFPPDSYYLQIERERGYDTFVKRNHESGETAAAYVSAWQDGVYKMAFTNDGSGMAVLYIRSEYNWLYGRCYFNRIPIYDLK